MLRILLLLIVGCSPLWAKTHVLVSVAPQKFLVEAIGGPQVEVEVIVPAGASPHTYEPSPKQAVGVSKGEIWFRLGEGFEEHLMPLLKDAWIVDQRDNLDLIRSCCGCGGHDPHIWLSPLLLKQQATQIEGVLSQYDPEHAELYKLNLSALEQILDELDEELATLLARAPQTILVSHPAFGYLCRDYGLEQLPIEMEGREPTPRYVTDLILKAKQLNIQTVFLQKQYSVRGGKRIARELGAECVYLDPYAENVIDNLRVLAKAFQQ